MSYDIYLCSAKTGKILRLKKPHGFKGGNYCIGSQEAWLNITYNYGKHYYRVIGEKGIRTIYGLTGQESIPILKDAINQLNDDVSPNYWDATEGNAKKALTQLLRFAKQKPTGIWRGD